MSKTIKCKCGAETLYCFRIYCPKCEPEYHKFVHNNCKNCIHNIDNRYCDSTPKFNKKGNCFNKEER